MPKYPETLWRSLTDGQSDITRDQKPAEKSEDFRWLPD